MRDYNRRQEKGMKICTQCKEEFYDFNGKQNLCFDCRKFKCEECGNVVFELDHQGLCNYCSSKNYKLDGNI